MVSGPDRRQEGWLSELVLTVDPAVAATVPVHAEPLNVAGSTTASMATSQSGGIGISQSEAQRSLEQLGYIFGESMTGHGVTVVSGTSPSGRVMAQLTGFAEHLEVTIKVSEALHEAERAQDLATLTERVRVFVPDWTEIADWIPKAIEQARTTQTPQEIELAGARTIMLWTAPHSILLTIKPKL